MFYTIYKTTNKINGKWYIGYHSTENLHDSYLGSGKNLKKAVKKYGESSFIKEILYVFPTKEEALQKESELITEDVVNNRMSYNVKLGGEGGWSHIQYLIENDSDWKNKRYSISDELRQRYANGEWAWNYHDGFKGKKHSEESKRKISENNGMRLDPTIIQNRIDQYNVIEKKWGYIKKLSEMWNMSHTNVRRFLKQYNLE